MSLATQNEVTRLEVPRWRHYCPSCARLTFRRNVYCRDCCAEYPARERFFLSVYQNRLKNQRLFGTPFQIARLMVQVQGIRCLECGKRISLGRDGRLILRHRCYYSPDKVFPGTTSCLVCRKMRSPAAFPVMRHGKIYIRVKICSTCLEGISIVTPEG